MKVRSFTKAQAKALLPVRKPNESKTAGGKSLVIAGSEGMFGAAVLAATAAARVGSGYVTLMTDQKKFPSGKYPDFLVSNIQKKNLAKVNYSAVAIGPGLGKSKETILLIKKLAKLKIANVVVDADALNSCAKNKWFSFPKTWILTPHEGELSRMLQVPAEKIKQDRRWAVQFAQKKFGCVVVLKGKNSLVADGLKVFEITAGNPALAKAGTGDVLTGMIAGLLAQKLSPTEAACLGVYVHGWLADQWIKKGNDHLSLMASDLLDNLPQALLEIRKS